MLRVSTHHLQDARLQPHGPRRWVIYHPEFFSWPFHMQSPLAHSIGTSSAEHVPWNIRNFKLNTELSILDGPHFAKWIYSRALKKNHNRNHDQMCLERYKLNQLGDWRPLLKTGLWGKRTSVTHREEVIAKQSSEKIHKTFHNWSWLFQLHMAEYFLNYFWT